mmetsp:Transcript_12655/g.24648  ORF Transcript_12655/g.24648 Transcript_12655/m.24648 type:complete len:135 (-) Transcript_12655:411-815(-)
MHVTIYRWKNSIKCQSKREGSGVEHEEERREKTNSLYLFFLPFVMLPPSPPGRPPLFVFCRVRVISPSIHQISSSSLRSLLSTFLLFPPVHTPPLFPSLPSSIHRVSVSRLEGRKHQQTNVHGWVGAIIAQAGR